MGALKIYCHCDENLMNKVLEHVVNHLSIHQQIDLSDIDCELEDIRLCIDFEVFMNTLKIKSAEILNHHWDLLYEDTAVLNSRLKPVLSVYNSSNKELTYQALCIRNEQTIA